MGMDRGRRSSRSYGNGLNALFPSKKKPHKAHGVAAALGPHAVPANPAYLDPNAVWKSSDEMGGELYQRDTSAFPTRFPQGSKELQTAKEILAELKNLKGEMKASSDAYWDSNQLDAVSWANGKGSWGQAGQSAHNVAKTLEAALARLPPEDETAKLIKTAIDDVQEPGDLLSASTNTTVGIYSVMNRAIVELEERTKAA